MEGPHIAGEQAREQPLPYETREKYWSELTDAEKIERMHDVVRNARIRIDCMQAEFDRMERHEHGHSGNVLVPLVSYHMGIVDSRRDQDRWF